jgi:hypothetical protein
MSEGTTKPPDEDSYEPYDVDVGRILRWGLGLVAMVVGTLVVSWVFFDALAAYESRQDPELAPMAKVRPPEIPPQPRLQVQPKQDLEQVLDQQNRMLSTYGWVDEKNGVVQVPIDRAMELVLKDGLPSRPAGEGKTP